MSVLSQHVFQTERKSDYRQQQAAVFLQSPHEAEEGHAGDDDAEDHEHAGYVEFGEAGGERGNPEVHQQVDAETEHDHAANLITEQLMLANRLRLQRRSQSPAGSGSPQQYEDFYNVTLFTLI